LEVIVSVRAFGSPLVVLFGLFGACTGVCAQPPTAAYAAAQLDMAQAELDGARAALQTNDRARALQLAAQAQLDARLAWGMTDSPFVRREALELAWRAERIGAPGVLAAGPRPARP